MGGSKPLDHGYLLAFAESHRGEVATRRIRQWRRGGEGPDDNPSDETFRPPLYRGGVRSLPCKSRSLNRGIRKTRQAPLLLHTAALSRAADTRVGTRMAGVVCEMCATASEHVGDGLAQVGNVSDC